MLFRSKVKGKGTLSIYSSHNSGIHSKDNVTIKNATLLIKAMNNGIRGNDKVKIEENPTLGIVAGNNGIRTSNSDQGSSSQHGYVYINGGNITINSYGDGIDAAYAVEFATSTDDEGTVYSPVVDIYTNIYSSYSQSTGLGLKRRGPGGGFDGGGMDGGSSAEKADDSAKAIKAREAINVSAGEIFCYAYDDCLHADSSGTLDNGASPKGHINISGGSLSLKSSDDAVHADGTLTVSDGTVHVAESHEGFEGKKVTITGGSSYIYASDDGVNASETIAISGGRLDVHLPANGDVDGIDSNGGITITGGLVIARGPNSSMAAPLDSDGGIKVSGGVVIVIGYCTNISSTLTKSTSQYGLNSGNHTVTISGSTIQYTNSVNYSGATTVFASASATIQ